MMIWSPRIGERPLGCLVPAEQKKRDLHLKQSEKNMSGSSSQAFRMPKRKHSRRNDDDSTPLNPRKASWLMNTRRAEERLLALDRLTKKIMVALVRFSECRTAQTLETEL